MLTGRKVLRNASWMLWSGYSSLLVSFIGNLVLARILLPDDFGVFVLASSLLAIVFMFAGFGSQEAIVQCHDDNIDLLIPTAYWMTTLLGVLLALVGTIVGVILSGHYDSIVIRLIIVLSWLRLLQNVVYVYRAILQRHFRFRAIAIMAFASDLVSFSVAIVAALAGWGVWALALREIIWVVLQLIGLGLISKYRLTFQFSLRAARWIWDFGWRMMWLRISEISFGRVDNLAVGTFLGTPALGHYSMAYRLSYLGNQLVQGSMQSVYHSTFASLQNSVDKLRYAFERLNFWLLRSVLLLGVIVLIAGENLVVLIYGEKWQAAGPIFQSMFLFVVMIPLGQTYQEFLVGAGQISRVMQARTVQLFVFIPLLLASAMWANIQFVVWAVSVSAFLGWILMAIHAGKVVSINWWYLLKGPVVAVFFAGCIGVLVAMVINDQLNLFWSLLFQITMIIGIYSLTLWLIERHSLKNEWQLVRTRFG